MKTISTVLITLIVVAVLGAGAYYFLTKAPTPAPEAPADSMTGTPATSTPTTGPEVIGKSAGGRDITAYHYGTGDKEILLVAGIHGGYEWNTPLLAFDAMDYFAAHPEAIAANERVTVIPVLNPDGLAKVVTLNGDGRFSAADIPANADTTAGRFNANTVDLNRNFDCDWQASGTWQSKTVSGGTAAFSEPETQAIKTYVEAHHPVAVVTYYSAAGGVYSSSCHNGVSDETKALTSLYAKASGYKAYEDFNFYDITGDMVNWLAKTGTPAISIVLTTHTGIEWDKNQAGINAVLSHYAQ
jgi:hypothetical protein